MDDGSEVPADDVTGVAPGRADRVLLLGIARSGTSWLGRALATAEGVRFYYEPDNVDADPEGLSPAGGRGFGPYPIIEPGDPYSVFGPLWDTVFVGKLPRLRGWRLNAARALLRMPPRLRDPVIRGTALVASRLPAKHRCTVVKSIYAVFCVDWLVERYQPRVVVVQRNPLNVVSSWRQLNIPLFDVAHRPAIREHYLEPRGFDPPGRDMSELGRIAWHVGFLTTVLGEATDRHPGSLIITHEDLCADPPTRFREVFDGLGLTWTPEVDRFLVDSNRPGEGLQPIRVTSDQPARWRSRLTDSEVAEVADVLARFPRGGWLRPQVLEVS